MISNDVFQGVRLVNETFSTSEAREIISGIIDRQINFYKLQQLSHWIRNHAVDNYPLDKKISELEENRQELMEMINEAMLNRRKVHLNCLLEMDIEYDDEMSFQ